MSAAKKKAPVEKRARELLTEACARQTRHELVTAGFDLGDEDVRAALFDETLRRYEQAHRVVFRRGAWDFS